MKKQWVGSRRKRLHGEMLGNAARGGGACKNPVRLSMQDGPTETVNYMWVNTISSYLTGQKSSDFSQ